MIIEASLDTN